MHYSKYKISGLFTPHLYWCGVRCPGHMGPYVHAKIRGVKQPCGAKGSWASCPILSITPHIVYGDVFNQMRQQNEYSENEFSLHKHNLQICNFKSFRNEYIEDKIMYATLILLL